MKKITLLAITLIVAFAFCQKVSAIGFEFKPSNTPEVTCYKDDTNCAYNTQIFIYNRSGKALYYPVLWTSATRPEFGTVKYMLNGVWVEGQNTVKEVVFNNHELANTGLYMAPAKGKNLGSGTISTYLTLYADGKACNQTNPLADCLYYAGTGFTVKFNLIDRPTPTPTQTPIPQPTATPTIAVMPPTATPTVKTEPTPTNTLTPTLTPTPTPTDVVYATPTQKVATKETVTPTNTTPSNTQTQESKKPEVCQSKAPEVAPIVTKIIVNKDKATLHWNKSNENITYYLLAYGEAPQTFQYGNPNIGGSDLTSYTVGGLAKNREYCFIVRPGNNCAPGVFSEPKCVKITDGQTTASSTILPSGFLKKEAFTTKSAILHTSTKKTQNTAKSQSIFSVFTHWVKN